MNTPHLAAKFLTAASLFLFTTTRTNCVVQFTDVYALFYTMCLPSFFLSFLFKSNVTRVESRTPVGDSHRGGQTSVLISFRRDSIEE